MDLTYVSDVQGSCDDSSKRAGLGRRREFRLADFGLRRAMSEIQSAAEERFHGSSKYPDQDDGYDKQPNRNGGRPIGVAGGKPGKPNRESVFTGAERHVGKRLRRRRDRSPRSELAGVGDGGDSPGEGSAGYLCRR